MESVLQKYGESVPPVPAPRYRRKLITNEDSKIVSSNQDTCVNEKIAVIVPPPRRKNKFTCVANTNTLITVPSKQNHYSSLNGNQEIHESVTFANSISNTSFKTKDIVIGNQNIASELEEKHVKSSFHTLVNIEDCDIIDNLSNCRSKMSPVGEPTENHIFDLTAENRVLGATLENTSNSRVNTSSQKQLDQYLTVKENREMNRVQCNVSENSATIVGVFYKPECPLRYEQLMNGDKLLSQPLNKELPSTCLLSSKLNHGNKTDALVPLGEYKKTSSKIMMKDSEENDSGVYFSDTKSPPHVDKIVNCTFINEGQKSRTTRVEIGCDIAFYKAFPCNAGDTIDNNTSEESGPQNYDMMLDYFEGQTVKSFREQITSQFQLNTEEINKERAVENWHQIEKNDLGKRESSLSLYLRSMLENESNKESLSPYPLSTVEEDEKSEIRFEEFKESKMVEDVCEKKFVPDMCTIPCSLGNHNTNSILATNDDVDFVVDRSDVNTFPVNIDCIVNFDNHNVNIANATSKTRHNEGSLKESMNSILEGFDTISFSNKQSLSDITTKPVDSCHLDNDSEMCDENTHTVTPLHSAQPENDVTTLIAFFENSRKEPSCIPSYYNNCFQSEEEMEKEDKYESDEKYIVSQENIQSSFNLSQNISTVKENPSEQNIISTPIISGEVDFECPDRDCKIGIKSIHFNEIVSQPKTIYSGLELKSSDNSIEYKTEKFGSTNEKEVYPIYDRKYDCLSLHSFSIQLPVESGKVLEDQQPLATEKDQSFHKTTQFNCNVDSTPSLTDCRKQFDNSVQEENMEDYIRRDKSFDNFYNGNNNTIIDTMAKPKFKPSTIPIVVFTESDLTNSSPIGSIELYPSEDIFQRSTDLGIDIRDIYEEVTTFSDHSDSQCNESLSLNSIEVVLEKNWGSVGLKIEGDEHGVLVSDVLAGGAANESGLVFQGWVDIKEVREETELFC